MENKSFKFSIIIPFYNVEKYIRDSIESIINQTLGFEKNIQMILIDDGSTDNSLNIALEYESRYPENIRILQKNNEGQACARNLGLKYAKGKYVNFLDSDDYLSRNTLKEVFNFFEENEDEIDIVAIPMLLFERVKGEHRLNYKFEKTGILDLSQNPNNPLLSSASAFIKWDAIKNRRFDTNLVNLEDALLINEILLDKKRYGVLNTCHYYYRQRMERTSTVDRIDRQKEYYTPRLKHFYKKLIDDCLSKEGHVPKFIQYLMVYDLQWLIKTQTLDILDDETEIDEFWHYLNYVLSHIDEEVILENENIHPGIRPIFLYLLGNEKRRVMGENNSIQMKLGPYDLDELNVHKIWLDIVKIHENKLNLAGMIISYFSTEEYSIRIIKKDSNNESTEYVCGNVKNNTPFRDVHTKLDFEWKYCYNFDVEIPLTPNVESELIFMVDYDYGNNKSSFELLLDFNKICKISKYGAYIPKKPYIILLKGSKLYIKTYSSTSMLRYEFNNLKKIIGDHPNFFMQAVLIRMAYLILYPFMNNRRIWIFADRPEFSEDNGKFLFKYAVSQDDDVEKYFVVNKDSSSYKEMRKISKNTVAFKSLKHKILFLFAEKNISSYANINFTNPFFGKNMDLYKGIETTEKVFLQHGVTKDNISNFINKFKQDLSLIVTVSQIEKESFLEEGYDYDESTIQVLGFPRYDNLKNISGRKQILLMPTWRLQLSTEEDFLNSSYYEYLNDFLNSTELAGILERFGYKLLFKPHPELLKYLDLLDIPKYITLATDESYQDLFNESSLLITDYSSVFFDFAYLKKPVIYYHPDDDYHYDEGYFDYETMGFGDVIKNSRGLFEKIRYYLDNDCEMEKKYKESVDEFFEYVDDNNSKRVYEFLKNKQYP